MFASRMFALTLQHVYRFIYFNYLRKCQYFIIFMVESMFLSIAILHKKVIAKKKLFPILTRTPYSERIVLESYAVYCILLTVHNNNNIHVCSVLNGKKQQNKYATQKEKFSPELDGIVSSKRKAHKFDVAFIK